MYLDLLLDYKPFLHLLFIPLFDKLSLSFLFFLELFEILNVLTKDLIAFLEGSLSFFSLLFQILYFLLDNSMSHSDKKHFLFLFKDINNGLTLSE